MSPAEPQPTAPFLKQNNHKRDLASQGFSLRGIQPEGLALQTEVLKTKNCGEE